MFSLNNVGCSYRYTPTTIFSEKSEAVVAAMAATEDRLYLPVAVEPIGTATNAYHKSGFLTATEPMGINEFKGDEKEQRNFSAIETIAKCVSALTSDMDKANDNNARKEVQWIIKHTTAG
eukprot:scaffold36620_cov32-Prasinocladus_malaysianus.AAC.1